MSEFHGFKCDRCGKLIQTGIRMSGDKKSEIQCGKTRHAYRFDLCNECWEQFIGFAKGRKTKDMRTLDAAEAFVKSVESALTENDDRTVRQRIGNALAAFKNARIAIEERDE